MPVRKEKLGNITIFTIEGIYNLEDCVDMLDLVCQESPELDEILASEYILVDCTNTKGVILEHTGGELFLLQKKFEEKKKGNFFYCGLNSDHEKFFRVLSKQFVGKELEIQNFKNREEAIEYIKSQFRKL